MGKGLKIFFVIVSLILALGAGFGAGWIVKDYIKPQEDLNLSGKTYAFKSIDYVWVNSATEADKANVCGMPFATFDESVKSLFQNMRLAFKTGGEVAYSNPDSDYENLYRATGDWEESDGKVIVTLYSPESAPPSKYTFEIKNGGIRINYIDLKGRTEWESVDTKCTDVYVNFKVV